jgi:hypothetical protein
LFAPRHDQIVAYATRQIECQEDEDATLFLGSHDGVKLWLNGRLVHVVRRTRQARFGEDKIHTTLRKGQNHLLLKINNTRGASGFFFAVLKEYKQNRPFVVDKWDVIGPFDNIKRMEGLDKVYPPEKGIDLKATYPGKHGTVGWKTIKTEANGYVNLQAFFAPRANEIVSYVTREIISPVEQDTIFLLGSDDGAKLWVNRAGVFKAAVARAAKPGQDLMKVKLKKGGNCILLKVNNGGGSHGFFLSILAQHPLSLAAKH